MATHLAEKGILFFYCTTNINDNIDGFEEVKEGLFVTDQYDYLKKHLPKYTLYMCANMNGCYLMELKKILSGNNDVLYEFIDDLHEDLTSISDELLERHKFVLKNKDIKVVTTAQYLYDKAVKLRGSNKNIIISTNGVVYNDFHITKKLPEPSNIKDIVTVGSDVGGYICKNCYTNEYITDEKTVKLLRMFEYVDIGKIKELNIRDKNKQEIIKFLEDYYLKYTGLYLKPKSFLNQIKQN